MAIVHLTYPQMLAISAMMYLEANEKRPATTYCGRPFRQKAVLEL